jgi:small subunit ribosomal protein S16
MAFYRIVAADSRSPRDGRFIEQLGYYDPLKDPAEIKVDTEKVLDWLGRGAKPSETVRSLLSRVGVMETWHHVRQGKTPEEITQIQEEARKRAEAVAAMERRSREAGTQEPKPAADEGPGRRETREAAGKADASETPAAGEEPEAKVKDEAASRGDEQAAEVDSDAAETAGGPEASEGPEGAGKPEGHGESKGSEGAAEDTQQAEPSEKTESES